MRNLIRSAASCVVFALVAFTGAAHADDWGNLSGRFVYDGKAPAPAALNINKDVEFCGKAPAPVDESLVVSDKGGLANVLIWVRTKGVKVNPEYEKTAKDKVILDNSHCRFDPHVVAMRLGQTLEVKNTDPMGHNTKIDFVGNNGFNQSIAAGETMDPSGITSPETNPINVSCTIHGWMTGKLLVRPDPYFAVSDKDGKFEIKNLPAGTELEFQVWQERPGNLDKAMIDGKPAAKGRFKYTIKPGNNDLGEIKLDPKQFAK